MVKTLAPLSQDPGWISTLTLLPGTLAGGDPITLLWSSQALHAYGLYTVMQVFSNKIKITFLEN